MPLDRDSTVRLRRAFPSALQSEVDAVAQILTPVDYAPFNTDIGPVTIDGEPIGIPGRMHFPEPDTAARDSLSPLQRRLLDCLYTRHTDGHVREAALLRILDHSYSFVPPYVIQLVGEYVFEIVELIRARVEGLSRPLYARFIAENPAFMHLTRQRCFSYWDCYYSTQWWCKEEYPAVKLLDTLEAFTEVAG